MESARTRELLPWPIIDRRRQVFRPRRSGRGEQAMVVTRLTAEMRMVRSAEDMGSRSARSDTEYMMMELMPQSCWANNSMPSSR